MNDVATRKHSGLGIAGFILAIVSLVTASTFFFAAMHVLANGLTYSSMVMIGILIIVTVLLSLIGLVFGIIAVCKKDRKKVFSIIGLIFNAIIFVGLVALLILGHFAVV